MQSKQREGAFPSQVCSRTAEGRERNGWQPMDWVKRSPVRADNATGLAHLLLTTLPTVFLENLETSVMVIEFHAGVHSSYLYELPPNRWPDSGPGISYV